MREFAIYLIALGVFCTSVTGEYSLEQDNQAAKHYPVIFLTLKLIDDVKSDLNKQISELQVSIDDLKSENNDLKLEVSGLSAVISEQEDTIELLESKFINYEAQRQDGKESGATYVRWGRTECPCGIGTVKIYDGETLRYLLEVR